MSRLATLVHQLQMTRAFTNNLLEKVEPADWFAMPGVPVTHIAWQVGHLAMAQYRLCLVRLRGERPEDSEVLAPEFLPLFGRGSVPSPDPGDYPAVSRIREVYDRVYDQVMRELPSIPDEVLDEPTLPAHPVFRTKGEALFWCAMHEMHHTGQITLIRRQLGHSATW